MTTVRSVSNAALAGFTLLLGACSKDSPASDSTGGALGSGGVTNSSGGSSAATGGASTGGHTASAGTVGSAGTTQGAGAAASGGAVGTAGAAASGGSAGAVTSAGNAGAVGNAGAAGSAGSAACAVTWTGSATRPQLDDASQACFTIANYLAHTGTLGALIRDNWDPTAGLAEASTLTPTFTVAADGTGTHTTVQAAIDAAILAGGSSRAFVLVKPGSYRELVCVKGTVPITLYGADPDAAAVTIAFDNYNGKTVDPAHTNPCAPPSGVTYGTSGSSTLFVASNGFQAMNLTVANDFQEGTISSGIQAVAMTAQGDQLVFQNVRFIGNQDTLQVKSPTGTTVARSYFKESVIEGDTDFIFGRGTAVFDRCTIRAVTTRKANGVHFAPSTEGANGFGFLVIQSKIVSDVAVPAPVAALGRSWDDSSATAPNGQTVIRESEIGPHVISATPWSAAATSSRPFNAATNRFYEYENTGPGAAP